MFNPDQRLNERYQLQQKLGRTAAGRQTWLATDLQSNEPVTVKLLAFSPEMEWDELKLFEREAQVLQALNHPRIPRYRDYFSLDRETGLNLPWFGLVQDYIPGFSLQELVDKNKRFSEEQVRAMAIQILDILIYLHELSPPVLHRDIKPSNLILGEDKQVYLVDFGAVQAQAAVTGVTFTVVGTSGYAPLEQFWGRAVAASDLYALGATLIHLLTGTAPADLPQKEGRIQFRDRVSLDSHLIRWIEQMTEITLEKRFSTAQQALETLEFGWTQPANPAFRPEMSRMAQPSGSLIKLHKYPERLEITIPAPGIRKLTQFGLLDFLLLLYLSLAVLIGLVAGILSFLSTHLNYALLLSGLLILLLSLLGKFLGERTLVIFDRHHNCFEIQRQTGFLNYGKQRQKLTDIWSVFLNNRGTVYEVRIRSQARIHRLGGALGENESAWLLQEIQDWLSFN
ncbi:MULTISPECIES: serine/threonine protein kinase [unclassified Coleofasciculus]|uniref:serine/threonine protein kinase n=1 Tax=unclassified Coleofasciculus TaxID=2692782 RepID=UPI00187FCAD0|nr:MULTISPECIES: serine/threonine-protein kinase [unclassified Coleofasciculus]MBE9124758.1 serine/threonine protein kinase [Coleofasciculus sp. LEGE 07081]MBE9148210.1 serine/threonine protein kinase [Coleofasciculus sp. LEGE 07092]